MAFLSLFCLEEKETTETSEVQSSRVEANKIENSRSHCVCQCSCDDLQTQFYALFEVIILFCHKTFSCPSEIPRFHHNSISNMRWKPLGLDVMISCLDTGPETVAADIMFLLKRCVQSKGFDQGYYHRHCCEIWSLLQAFSISWENSVVRNKRKTRENAMAMT